MHAKYITAELLNSNVNALPAQRSGGTLPRFGLQLSEFGGYIPAACLLLNFQADVNAPASKVNGGIALEGAAEHGRLDTLQLWLNAGSGNAGKDQGRFKRAKALANSQGHSHITSLLENHLQRRRQEHAPVILADRMDDDLDVWDPDRWTDGGDMAPMNWWMEEDTFSSDYWIGNNVAE